MTALQLASLPEDVLLIVLQQDSLGAYELCSLEMCNTMLRRMIDEDLWKQAFLRQRLCNALQEPYNWKQEAACRSAWSSGWRKLGIARRLPPSNVRGRAQILCRLVKQMGCTGSPACVAPSEKGTHIVDPNDPRCFMTIGSALARASPFDKVHVRPGLYSERLYIEKSVEIIGTGKIGSTVIEGIDGPTIWVRRLPHQPLKTEHAQHALVTPFPCSSPSLPPPKYRLRVAWHAACPISISCSAYAMTMRR